MRQTNPIRQMGIFCVTVLILCGGIYVLSSYIFNDSAGNDKDIPNGVSATKGILTDDQQSHAKMLAILKEIKEKTDDDHPYFNTKLLRQYRQQLEQLPADESDVTRMTKSKLLFELGQSELILGQEKNAIAHMKQAEALISEFPNVPDQIKNLITFRLGVANLRLGETQNCCQQNSPQSCIVPIRGKGIHTKQEGSREAIKYFTKVLENTSEQSEFYYGPLWLLNIAYMTVGEYPDSVPKPYLIDPDAFASQQDIPHFVNIAERVGLDTFSLSGGAIADDFNNDGFLDLVVSTWDTRGEIQYFVNNQDGTFTNRSKEAQLEGIYGGINIIQADYDNDGDVDIFILRGAWLGKYGRQPNSLLRNNQDGTFTDVTFAAGLGEVHYPTQTAAWADYDNDGDLDLYIGNEAEIEGYFSAADRSNIDTKKGFPNQLFRNNGDGTFTDVAESARVTNNRFCKAVVWGDYDNDGYPDLYVSNLGVENRLYHNNRDGTFTDVAQEAGVQKPLGSFPAWFWDFDNDGNQDLFVSSFSTMVAQKAAFYRGLSVRMELEGLYRGNGKGGFDDVTQKMGLSTPTLPMGSNFGDLNNDGYPDFYLGTGDPDYMELMPNVMYLNIEGRQFVNVTTSGGFGHLQKGHAVIFADLDNDGDQDVFEQMGGAYLGDKYYDALYENPGFGNHWLSVKLVGVASNRSAIGARIKVDIQEAGKTRSIYKTVRSGGSFGANPLRQAIGLGKADKITILEVFWPRTGKTQSFKNVGMNQFIQITEDQNRVTKIELKTYKLGGSL